MFHTIFFDLDNTLYSRNSGIWEAIGQRINQFMIEVLHIPESEVMPLRISFHKNFGTTLMGLKNLYEVDDMEYLAFVHDVDLNELLTDDGQLKSMLSTLPHKKIIFTNSDILHAQRVLEFFKVRDMFEYIVDVIAIDPNVKPQPEAYQKALNLSGVKSTDGCVFVDDMIENVIAGNEAGFTSILVGESDEEIYSIEDIFKLPEMLSKLEMNKK